MSLGDLKSRIQDEINRTDLDTQIELAIRSAVNFFAAETLWFQEERVTAETITNQEYYALPDDYVTVNSIRITINDTNDYLLKERSNTYFEEKYQPSSVYTGYPIDWTIYDQQLRLGPIPNDEFPMVLHYIRVLPDLGSDEDSNTYTVDLVEQMTRARAKWDLYTNLIRDYHSADRMKAAEVEAYRQIRKRSRLFVSDNTVRRYL